MQQELFIIKTNQEVAKDLFLMELNGNTKGIMANGDFVNISVPGTYLRRPISVFDVQEQTLSIVYKVVGSGTAIMATMENGDELDLLTGLGNGYDIGLSGKNPLVVGGGYGAASIYGFSKALTLAGKNPTILLGFNTKEDAFLLQKFYDLQLRGASVYIMTVDGSLGDKGFVTDFALDSRDNPYSFIYACGPTAMLKALAQKTDIPGQFSFEERMGCGFGACMGCSIMTKSGPKRVCKEGPVLDKEEILWTQE